MSNFGGVINERNVVRFSPDGKTVFAVGSDFKVAVVDAKMGKAKDPIKGKNLPGGATGMDLSPDGKPVAVVGRGVLRFYDAATGKLAGDYEVHPNYGVDCVAFSPDGTRVARHRATNVAFN